MQSMANKMVAVGALVPYAAYAGAYYLRRHHHFGQRGNSYLFATEYVGLRVDERLDSFKRRHLGRNENDHDEHFYGSYCPRFAYSWSSACRSGGRLYGWLPGSYRRNGRTYRDY